MSNLKVNSINDASGGSTAVLYGVAAPTNSMGFRNRIINGDMRIDQRNAGASVSYAAGAGDQNKYNIDRWTAFKQTTSGGFTVQRSSTAPAGFTNSIAVTISSAYTSTENTTAVQALSQFVEGYNVADLGWGTANAQAITVSFWVRSSVTGIYTFAAGNVDYNRQYLATYTINSANTWEYKTITIAGDTAGTWSKENTVGMRIWFDLGTSSNAAYTGTTNAWNASGAFHASNTVQLMATNGATFYITGVQLEAGSVASPFERRDYGRELMMCQRYCYGQNNSAGQAYYWFGTGAGSSTTSAFGMVQFPVTMRSSPTATFSAANTFFLDPGITNFTSVVIDQKGVNGGACTFTGGSGMTAGYGGRFLSDNTDAAFIIWSAEL